MIIALHLVLVLLTVGTILSLNLLLLRRVIDDLVVHLSGHIFTAFYDRPCGLCHYVVRFLLAED